MRNKDYRELQISSSSLVFIFLSIILLGIIIFLLGVSVGKKQVRLAADLSPGVEPAIEKIVDDKPSPKPMDRDPVRDEIDSHKQAEAKPEPAASLPTPEKTTPPPESRAASSKPSRSSNMYFVQVGAYQSRDGALEHASQLRSLGFPCEVHEPVPGSSRRLYKVRVGGYATRPQAESALEKVALAEKKTKGDYFITRY